MLQPFLHELFDFDVSTGRRWFFRAFELFVVVECSVLGWMWAVYVTRIVGVTHALGLANYVDLSLLYLDGMAFVAASVLTVLLATAFFGRLRWAYAAALVLLHVLYVARYSLGKVGHGTNLVGMCLLSLAIAYLFFGDADARRTVALGLARFSVGFSYVLAAVSKLVGTGLDWPAGSHLAMWMTEKGTDVLARTGSYDPNLLQTFLFDQSEWATVTLAFGLVAEAMGWLFWFRSTRVYVTVALIALHLGIAATMNIRFDLNIAVLVLLGMPWSAYAERWATARRLEVPASS